MQKGLEVILWSIAFPGFGQILNHQLLKGFVFIFLELLINVQSGLNKAIISSFCGQIETSIHQVDYQWLMFYPCIYVFAIWDAYREATIDVKNPFSFIPFVCSAYLGTVGVIYSPIFKISGILLGPIWLSIIFLILGLLVGYIIKPMLIFFKNKFTPG